MNSTTGAISNSYPAHISAKQYGLVFPGQGSQYVGMGRDVYDRYPAARHLFEEADAILGFSLSRICFEGPEDELTDTINAQPAILTTSAACLAGLEETLGERLKPTFVAGHSMGEYTALLAAGVLDSSGVEPFRGDAFATALRLVRERGRLMKEAGRKEPGGMAAVLGLQAASLRAICEKVGDVCVANDNCPGQIVLSGKQSALEEALLLAKESGAKRTIPLAVSIASHSPLMASAADALAMTVEKLPLAQAAVPIISNVSALPLTEPADIRLELVRQLISPVRWTESVQYMIAQGVRTFIEIGPKNVLSRLINQIDSSMQVFTTGSVTDIAATAHSLLEAWAE